MADQIRLDGARREADRLSKAIAALRKGKRSPGGSAADIGEDALRVAKVMGVDPEDIKKYGFKEPFSESGFDLVSGVPVENTATAVLKVAKAMGNSPEDIIKYGLEEPSSESEAELIEEEGRDLDDAVSRVAKAMDNSPEDLKRFGY